MNPAGNPYLERFRGGFSGILRWTQLDALWQRVIEDAGGRWYLYTVSESLPTSPADARQLRQFIDRLDELLRREHGEDYCGIVYADSPEQPTFIKVYDPKNLGVVCGCNDNPPLPGWTLSKLKPVDLSEALTPPAVRKRWWQRLMG
jgi:hypothetical protein